MLGSGEGELEAGFRYAASANPDNVAVFIGYSEPMSHRFMAGADILLVPSRFEPCGLTQLYAMRYGTLPLVRRVGGLSDTVVDVNSENLAADKATGFVFNDAARQALGARIREASAHQFARRAKDRSPSTPSLGTPLHPSPSRNSAAPAPAARSSH